MEKKSCQRQGLQLNQNKAKKWSRSRTLKTWILRIALARLNGAAKNFSFFSLIRRDFDPILLEVKKDGKPIGCCSLLKRGEKVYEVELICFDAKDQYSQAGQETVNELIQYVKNLGGVRILAGLGSLADMNLLLLQYGFKSNYSDDVLFFNL